MRALVTQTLHNSRYKCSHWSWRQLDSATERLRDLLVFSAIPTFPTSYVPILVWGLELKQHYNDEKIVLLRPPPPHTKIFSFGHCPNYIGHQIRRFTRMTEKQKPMILMMFAMILMMIILMIMMSKMTEKQPNIKRFGKKFTNFSTIAW